MLTTLINLPENVEHDLPWYPPVCNTNENLEHFLPSIKEVNGKQIKQSSYLRNSFLNYVNGGKSEEAEIGQRIVTALNKVA